MNNLMTQEREAAILEGAIRNFGVNNQIIVAIEEMTELTQALTKWLRNPGIGRETDIREEMADVWIMLNQLALIFGDCTDEEIFKLERLERTVQRDDP